EWLNTARIAAGPVLRHSTSGAASWLASAMVRAGNGVGNDTVKANGRRASSKASNRIGATSLSRGPGLHPAAAGNPPVSSSGWPCLDPPSAVYALADPRP